MGKCWFKPDRVVVNPVNLWLPVNRLSFPGDWDFDVVSVDLKVIQTMGGCDCCGYFRSRAVYVLASEENLLCQRCFYRWLDKIDMAIAV